MSFLKTRQINISIEFKTFELFWTPNNIQNNNFEFLEQICSKRVLSVQNKKVNITAESRTIEVMLVQNFT